MARFVVLSGLVVLVVLTGCAASEPPASTAIKEPVLAAATTTGTASIAATPATEGGTDSEYADSEVTAVRAVFDQWVAAMTVGDVPAAVERFWDAEGGTHFWAQGDVQSHCSAYRISDVEVSGDSATVTATFRVEQREWSDGTTDDTARDVPYEASLRKNSEGQWKLVWKTTQSLFMIDR